VISADDLTRDDLAAALLAAGPDPGRAAELDLFGRFVGAWDVEWHGTFADGRPGTMTGELHFGWVMDGRAVQDVYSALWIGEISDDNRQTWRLDERMYLRRRG
jgi:hypothetical protein